LAGFFQSAAFSLSFEALHQHILKSFAFLFSRCENDYHVCFARHFIQKVAVLFAEKVDDQRQRPLTYSLIAIEQIVRLTELRVNTAVVFLTNVDHRNFDELFRAEWKRCEAIRTEIYQLYLKALLYRFTRARDQTASVNLLKEFPCQKTIGSLFESEMIGLRFELELSLELAEAVPESKLPKEVKLRALRLLQKVYPKLRINPVLRAAGMIKPLSPFSSVSFQFVFHAPSFLIGQEAH
jgi:hypothetical protein